MENAMDNRRKWFVIITLVLFLFMGLLLVETGLHIFWNGEVQADATPARHPYTRAADPEVSYTLKPNYYYKNIRLQTNADGFRIPEQYKPEKPEGVYRVAFLGDSVIQGYNTFYHYTIPRVLEKSLREISPNELPDVQVLNFGVPGYNMSHYLAVLKKYALKYSPDYVIVGVSIYNDFNGYRMEYLDRGYLHPQPVDEVQGYNYELKPPSRFLWMSYIYRLFYYKCTPSWIEKMRGPAEHGGKFRYIRKRLPASCRGEDPIWERIHGILDEFAALAEKHEFKMLFVLFPSREQVVYSDLPRAPQEILKKLLRTRGLECLDLDDDFSAQYSASGHIPFRDEVSHPDNQMNIYTAHSICDHLLKEKIFFLNNRFPGRIELGKPRNARYLSIGWHDIESWNNKLIRMTTGSHARVIFKKHRDSVSALSLSIVKYPLCEDQKVRFEINGEEVGSIDISSARSLMEYQIKFPPVKLSEKYNSLDLFFSCARLPAKFKKSKKNTPFTFSARVESIELN